MMTRQRTFRLAELAHIESCPLPEHLRHLREDWDEAKVEPITLRQPFGTNGTGDLILFDGNHRLTLARERGDREIEAIVQIPAHCRE